MADQDWTPPERPLRLLVIGVAAQNDLPGNMADPQGLGAATTRQKVDQHRNPEPNPTPPTPGRQTGQPSTPGLSQSPALRLSQPRPSIDTVGVQAQRMADDSRNTNWKPAQDQSNTQYNSPAQDSGARETFSSPTSPESAYPGHFNSPRPLFAYDANYSNDSGYPSPSHGWDPLQQNPPTYNQRGESLAGLLSPFRGDRSPTPPRAYPHGQGPPTWWTPVATYYKRYWTPAWSMVFFLVAGLAFACGHHVYYRQLDGTMPDQQLRKLRYGTALAFFAKTSLVTAVILAYRQRVWMIVRRKILPLGVVDSLFAAAEDLLSLLHWEAFKRAKVAMFLALYIWSTPLVVILTSETLSVQPKLVREENTTCAGIHTLNFDQESTNDWRLPNRTQEGLIQLSVSLWNATVGWDAFNRSDPNSFDYWTSSSLQFEKLASNSRYLGKTLSRDKASEEICGKAWNCSFIIEFTGPGYKCQKLASGINSTVQPLGGAEAPFGVDKLLPEGDYKYFAINDQGDYGARQLEDVNTGGMPKTGPPFPPNLGAFRTEPLLWIGYVTTELDARDIPTNAANRSTWNNDTTFIPHIMGCEHYETEYRVNITYENEIQNNTFLSSKNISRIIETRFLPGQSINMTGLLDTTSAEPETGYVMPRDVSRYRKVAAYHSVGKQLRDTLNGTIDLGNIALTDVHVTRLIEKRNYLTIPNFEEEVESYYQDMVLSMLSDPQFAVVSWAHNPKLMAGQKTDEGHGKGSYKCTRERTTNAYKYHARDLWLVYSIAILLATIAVMLGISAMRHENTYRDTRFSSIVAVTRGRSLNDVGWDTENTNVKDVKIGFGRVRDVAGDTKHGFGLEGEVTQDKPDESTLRSPVIQMKEWRERRATRLMDGSREA